MLASLESLAIEEHEFREDRRREKKKLRGRKTHVPKRKKKGANRHGTGRLVADLKARAQIAAIEARAVQ